MNISKDLNDDSKSLFILYRKHLKTLRLRKYRLKYFFVCQISVGTNYSFLFLPQLTVGCGFLFEPGRLFYKLKNSCQHDSTCIRLQKKIKIKNYLFY